MSGNESTAPTDASAVPDLHIAQDSRVKSEGWWEWWAWIEGSDADLDRVEKVAWHLHRSFPRPVVPSTDRQNKFILRSSGWGVFTLRATLYLRSGGELELEHLLRLASDAPSRAAPHRGASLGAGEPAEAPARSQRRVFLSYSLADAPVGRELRRRLREEGVEVMRADDAVEPGESVSEAISRSIGESDLVVAVSSPEAGEFQEIETDVARKKGKPVFRIQVDDPRESPRPTRAVSERNDLVVTLDRSQLKSAIDAALGDASLSILQSIDKLKP